LGLSIKNDEVETMIRQLAARRGVSLTEAVRQALSAELARDEAARGAEMAAKMAEIQAIIDRTANLPRLNDLSDNELLGYDGNGLST
jgi:antitoxin VapB